MHPIGNGWGISDYFQSLTHGNHRLHSSSGRRWPGLGIGMQPEKQAGIFDVLMIFSHHGAASVCLWAGSHLW